jgi:hypothetical protein
MGILSLLVKIGVDSSQFETGVKRVEGIGSRFGSNFSSAITSKLGKVFGATAVIAGVTAFAKKVTESADEIKDLAEQLNLSTDQIQRLQILAGETGITFDKFGSVLNKFEQVRIKATQGDEDAIKTLKALGFTTKDINDVQIQTIDGAIKAGEAYKASGNSAEASAAMVDLYGLKLKAAGAAIADYKTTGGRMLMQESDINTLSNANNLLAEQFRIIKNLASPTIAVGVKATADALKSVTKPTESYLTRFDKTMRKAATLALIRNMPDDALARIVQQRVAEDKLGKQSDNPPPLGKQEFERVAGEKFSFGQSQDSLARIGGFTGFQSSQDAAIRNAIEQTLQLKLIVKNTDKTANNTRD